MNVCKVSVDGWGRLDRGENLLNILEVQWKEIRSQALVDKQVLTDEPPSSLAWRSLEFMIQSL